MSAEYRETWTVAHADLDRLEGIARHLAPTLVSGDVVLLVGDLGAGKTTFTKAVAAALGVVDVVTSPTFTIAHAYEPAAGAAISSLMHVDAYRLRGADDLDAVGLFDALDDGAAVLVEWGDIVADAFDDALVIGLGFVDEFVRSITITWTVGGRWASRAAQWEGRVPC